MPGKPWRRDKIGIKAPIPDPVYEDLRDPANGAKVARCKVCGLPSSRVMVGEWCGLRGRMPICERCWFSENPPDPLHEAA